MDEAAPQEKAQAESTHAAVRRRRDGGGPLETGLELALPMAALVAALSLAPRSALAVPASTAVHAATLLAGLLVSWRLDRLPRALDGWLAAALALLAEHQLLWRAGSPWGDDARLHLWASAALTDALRAGELPLWLHPLANGVPLLQFYPPLGFAPIVGAHLAGLSLPAAFRGAFVLFAMAAAVGAQRAARALTRDRRAGLVAATALAFAPYRLFDAHGRAALGEVAGIALLPWLLLGFVRLLRRPRARLRGLAWPAAALAFTHLLTALLAVYPLAAWAATHCAAGLRRGGRRCAATCGRLLGAGALAAALAAVFLLPLLVDLPAVSVGRIVPVEGRFASPGVRPLHWLGAERDAADATHDGGARQAAFERHYQRMPVMPLGATLLAGVAMVATQLARGGRAGRALRLGLVVGTATALALSLDALLPLVVRLPGLRTVQFPWRALGIASATAALCVGLAAAGTAGDARRTRHLRAVLLFAALVVEGWLHTGVRRWLSPWQGVAAVVPVEGRPGWFRGETLRRPPPRLTGLWVPPPSRETRLRSGLVEAFIEYSRPEVFALRRVNWPALGVGFIAHPDGLRRRLAAAPYAQWSTADGARRRLHATAAGGHIRLRSPARPGTVRVREQCFPGWQQRTAEGWRAARCQGGFLAAATTGRQRVEWRFFPWRWHRLTGAAISGAALLALVLVSARGGAGRSRRRGWRGGATAASPTAQRADA